MKVPMLNSVWLLTWEGTEGLGTDDNTKIAGLISGGRSDSFVSDVCRTLFCSSRYYVSESIGEIRRPELGLKIPSGGTGSILICYNPFLKARKVEKFVCLQDNSGNESLSWIEPATYRLDQKTLNPQIDRPEIRKSLIRHVGPVLRLQ